VSGHEIERTTDVGPQLPPLGGPHRRVADVMTTDLVVATPSTSVPDLARMMRENAVSALPVVDEDGRPVGVVSEADLLVKERELAAHHGGLWMESHPTAGDRVKAEALEAAELMSSPPATIGGEASLAAAARRMAERGVRRLLVVDDVGRLRGLVSRRDLLKVYETGDDELRRRVLEALAPRAYWTDLDRVDIAVTGGVVTLRGPVPYRSDALALAGIATAIEGVGGVRNQLTAAADDVGHFPEAVATPGPDAG
jgi:CBS domain-containing protein